MQKAYYKNLIIYQKAKSLTLETINLVHRHKNTKYNFIFNQLLRSVSSIGANIAEGYGRHYKKSYRQFIAISRGSSLETDYWLEIVLELKIFNSEKVKKLISDNLEITKMLTAMMKKLEN